LVQVEFWGPYKILLIGNATVGKSSLLRRFVEGKYSTDYYSATVGIDYKRKVVKLTEKAAVKLQIWDTAGQVGSKI
jgi:small GTP-binding protein